MSDDENFYKKKYIKYKEKYQLLKAQKGGGKKLLVIWNDGSRGSRMSNQCLWISVSDFLVSNGYPHMTHEQIRTEAKDLIIEYNNKLPVGWNPYTINEENKVFDFDKHRGVAELVAEKYNLQLEFYLVNSETNELISSDMVNMIGDGQKNVPIASYGSHFQLILEASDVITSSKETNIKEKGSDFNIDLKLSAGISKDDNINKDQQDKIKKIIDKEEKFKMLQKRIEIEKENIKRNMQHIEDNKADNKFFGKEETQDNDVILKKISNNDTDLLNYEQRRDTLYEEIHELQIQLDSMLGSIESSVVLPISKESFSNSIPKVASVPAAKQGEVINQSRLRPVSERNIQPTKSVPENINQSRLKPTKPVIQPAASASVPEKNIQSAKPVLVPENINQSRLKPVSGRDTRPVSGRSHVIPVVVQSSVVQRAKLIEERAKMLGKNK
jgi:hypothetical protein